MKQVIITLIITVMINLPVQTQAQYSSYNRQAFSEYDFSFNKQPSSEYNLLPSERQLLSEYNLLPSERQLLSEYNFSFDSQSFSEDNFPTLRGPWEELPNNNTGGGGWVGAPIKDAYWLLSILAMGYGIIHRNIRHKN